MNTRILPAALCGIFLAFVTLAADWHVRPAPTNSNLHALARSERAIVAVGDNSTILISSDGGATWRQAPAPFPGLTLRAVAYGYNQFVAAGDSVEIFSKDGTNWTHRTGSVPAQTIYGLTFGQAHFVGVGIVNSNQQPMIFTSYFGSWWLERTHPAPTTLRAVTFGRNTFVAVGDGGLIMTSSNSDDWTRQHSGATANLRAVTWTGSRFIAAGEGGAVLASPDGAVWTITAPASFTVNALAASRAEVVAAGSFGPGGRLHESPDGITWPGNSAQYPSALNALVIHTTGKYLAVGNGGLILASELTVNSWTKPASGDWQEPFWSLGRLPSMEDSALMLTNAGWKAVAIQSSTSATHPNSLRVRSLAVDAPADSRNLLLLNYAGFSAPFNPVNDLTVGPQGSLLSYYSAIEGGTLSLSGGRATFAELAQTRFGGVYLTNGAELVISNGWFEANEKIVSGTNATTIRQFGGTNHIDAIRLNSNARYFLASGTLIATNLSIWWGLPHTGPEEPPLFVQSGGEARISSLFMDSGADYELTGGTLAAKTITIGAGVRLELKGGTIISNQTLILRGGTLVLVNDGEYRLGHLMTTGGRVDFQSGRKTLRIPGAGYPPPLLDGYLTIRNWTGPASSPTRDQFFIGDNPDAAGYQLKLTSFADPEGYPRGTYRAKALANGEIIPLEPVPLRYARSSNTLILTWPDEDFELLSATDVTGEYHPITRATSPYTATFTGPHRFFKIRPIL